MTDPDFTVTLAQFGAAGLMGWMWLSERRSAVERERQLTEAHERLLAERTSTSTLLHAIEANTRALAAIEGAQRELLTLLARLKVRLRFSPQAPPPSAPSSAPAQATPSA